MSTTPDPTSVSSSINPAASGTPLTDGKVAELIKALNDVTTELKNCLEKVEPKPPVVATSTVATTSRGGKKRRNSRKNAKKDANKRQHKSRRR